MSGTNRRLRGCWCWAGSSQAIPLTAAMTIGGENPRPPGPRHVLKDEAPLRPSPSPLSYELLVNSQSPRRLGAGDGWFGGQHSRQLRTSNLSVRDFAAAEDFLHVLKIRGRKARPETGGRSRHDAPLSSGTVSISAPLRDIGRIIGTLYEFMNGSTKAPPITFVDPRGGMVIAGLHADECWGDETNPPDTAP